MRSIGLDVHRQFAEVAVAQGGQAVPSGHRFEASPAGLLAFARSLGKEDQVVLEATVNTWAIVDVLAAHAGRVVVSNPLRTRAIASAKVKTDKIDAATLAQLLAADFLPEVWIPDPETRSRRAQVAHRAGLVQQRSRLRNRVPEAGAQCGNLARGDLSGGRPRGRSLPRFCDLPKGGRVPEPPRLTRLLDQPHRERSVCIATAARRGQARASASRSSAAVDSGYVSLTQVPAPSSTPARYFSRSGLRWGG
jgi:transposase